MSATITRAQIANLLVASLGEEKANEVVGAAATKLGVGPDVSRTDALRILEKVAETSGLVGIAARFAKSRAIMLWR
jgi:hypothetical protein